MNTIELKSLLLYYYHDLENRISKHHREEYIKYKHDNTNFTKDELFTPLIEITDSYREMLLNEIKGNEDSFNLFKFLFYTDEKYFVDYFTFFMIANFNIVKIENGLLQKEITIFKSSLGL